MRRRRCPVAVGVYTFVARLPVASRGGFLHSNSLSGGDESGSLRSESLDMPGCEAILAATGFTAT